MADIQLHLNETPEGDFVIRQGKAADEVLPVKIELKGDIHSVSNFLSVRMGDAGIGREFQEVNLSEAIVKVNKKDRTITLDLTPNNPYSTVITAKLELSDELLSFGISTGSGGKEYTREALVKMLRFSKIYFPDKERHEELLNAYMAFKATTQAEINQASDNKGNKAMSFVKDVKTNLPTEFILFLPVFKGERRQRFRVEICYDVTDGGARFWFESVELAEMMQEQQENIFDEELKACEGFVIINQ